jgi:N6-adenosine-specific RNA methylase IME4
MIKLAKIDPNAPGLLSVERARAWLAEAVAIDEVKSLRDKAEAIASYQRKQKAGREAAIDADLVVVFAERRIGELSRELPKEKPRPGKPLAKTADGSGKGKALAAQGIKRRSASRYEAAASIPEPEFERLAKAEAAKGRRVTMRRILEPKRREARDAELVAQSKSIKNERNARCSVLLADPPWRYEHCEDEDGRSIEKQYPTLTLDKICAWDIDAICTRDAVLFLWVTSPKLAEGMHVLDAWGFTYRTCMVWVKDRIGMGYYARQRHELLLIGTKGSVAVPAAGDRPDSVIEAPRGKHSAKPTIAYEIIERMYPRLAKGELFARSKREEWLSWGYEA